VVFFEAVHRRDDMRGHPTRIMTERRDRLRRPNQNVASVAVAPERHDLLPNEVT